MNGANYIIHVANPLPSSQNKYKKKEMAKQAVSGMRTILDHCKANRVKKLIITSSIVSMVDYKKKGPKPTYDHTDFAEKSVDEYAQSKIEQEKEIIQFLNELRAGGIQLDTEICTLHPSFILGPVITKYSTSSVDGVRKMGSGETPALPDVYQPCVDVRDCAQAHVNALLAP